MIPDSRTAGICGLFCGTCSMYPDNCHGCLSDKLAPHCRRCPNGFRDCAASHGVTRCYECKVFPCGRLRNFLDSHWENGISHHAAVIDDLERMKAIGIDDWVAEQIRKATCPKCGKLVLWYKQECGCDA